MSHKTLGYLFLTLGIVLIIGALVSVFLVFTKRAEPISFFELESITIDPAALAPQASAPQLPQEITIGGQTVELPFQQQGQPPKNTDSAGIELFPGEALSNSMNIFLHLVLMGFVANIGSRFANIGTQLVRPIVIKSKTIHEPSTQAPPPAV